MSWLRFVDWVGLGIPALALGLTLVGKLAGWP